MLEVPIQSADDGQFPAYLSLPAHIRASAPSHDAAATEFASGRTAAFLRYHLGA
jgi:hypothetical protein